jgi:hypothetical protein
VETSLPSCSLAGPSILIKKPVALQQTLLHFLFQDHYPAKALHATTCSSVTPVNFYETTRYHIPQDSTFNHIKGTQNMAAQESELRVQPSDDCATNCIQFMYTMNIDQRFHAESSKLHCIRHDIENWFILIKDK